MNENIIEFKLRKLSSNNLSENVDVTLHNEAVSYLFEHFYSTRRIFSNVLGQMEIDFISIAIIDKSKKLFFLSSCPSIEKNLIERNLWKYDNSYSESFISKKKPKLWSDLYDPEYAKLIYQFKQSELKINSGISIPHNYEEYNIVFSYGFKSEYLFSEKEINKLKAIGCFCLRELMDNIPMLDKINNIKHKKPKLKLIYNKED